MSTYLYLECLDHDPPLRANDESGQHLSDLPQIRADLANRDALVRLHAESDYDIDLGHFFRNYSLAFLVQHPKCHIGIRDEYGDRHATTDEHRPATESMPISDHDFENDEYASVGCCTAMVRKDDGPDMCGMPAERHGDPWCRHCWPDGGSNYPPCQRHTTDQHRETPMTETNDGGVA